MTMYIHYRNIDPYGEYEPCGGATVAIDDSDGSKVIVGIARCNPKDNFNRKVGREIAEGRIAASISGREIENVLVFDRPTEKVHIRDYVASAIEGMMEYDTY